MLDKSQAEAALKQALPTARIQDSIKYRNVYLFRVHLPSPGEEDYDPFFSVDEQTGEVRDFSVITDGDISEIAALFANNQQERR